MQKPILQIIRPMLSKMGLDNFYAKVQSLTQRLESTGIDAYEVTCMQYLLLLNPGMTLRPKKS